MDTFSEALLSGTTNKIPESFDWFAPLLGDWDCDYYDEYVKGEKRHVKGECWKAQAFRISSSSLPEPLRKHILSPTVNTDRLCACSTRTKNGTTLSTPVQAR